MISKAPSLHHNKQINLKGDEIMDFITENVEVKEVKENNNENRFAIEAILKGGENVELAQEQYKSGDCGSIVLAIRHLLDKVDEVEKVTKEGPEYLRKLVPEFEGFRVVAYRADGTIIDQIKLNADEEYQIANKAMAFICSVFTYC